MFSRADELVEVFNALKGALTIRGSRAPSERVGLAEIAAEARANLRTEGMYTLINVLARDIAEGHSLALPQWNISGMHQIEIAVGGRFTQEIFKDHAVGEYFLAPGDYFSALQEKDGKTLATLFRDTNLLLVDSSSLTMPNPEKIKLAQAIDSLVDSYTSVLVAGDGYWPTKGNGPTGQGYQQDKFPDSLGVVSHDCPCVVNPTSQETHVLMRILYENGTKPVEYGWIIGPNRSLHARLDLITDRTGVPMIAKDTPYSVVIYTDNPSLHGVMSRAWAGEEGTANSLMSASLARVDLPMSERMLASDLTRRVDASREKYKYKILK